MNFIYGPKKYLINVKIYQLSPFFPMKSRNLKIKSKCSLYSIKPLALVRQHTHVKIKMWGKGKIVTCPSSSKAKFKQGVCHTVALPFTINKYFKPKEELWKFIYFTMQKCNLKKKSSKRNQNPSRYHTNSITNLKFQYKPKYHVSKNPHIKIDRLPKGQNPLIYYTLQ